MAVRNILQKSEGPHLLGLFGGCQVQSGADESPIFLMPAGRHFCLGWKQQRVTAQLSRDGCEVSAPQSLTTTTSCTHTPRSASRVFIVVGLWPWETLAFRISLKFHYSFLSTPSFILCLFMAFFSKKECFLSPIYLFIHLFIAVWTHEFLLYAMD